MSHRGRFGDEASGCVDQEARNLATRGIALIEAHERVCTERARAAAEWRTNAGDKLDNIEAQLGERISSMATSIRGVYNRLWLAGCGLVGVLLTVIGYLIVHRGL